MLARTFLWAILLVLSRPTSAAEKPADSAAPTPKPPDRRELWVPADKLKQILTKHPNAVILSRAEYETLVAEATSSTSKAPEPPVRATFSSATYRAQPAGKVLQISAEFTVHSVTEEWVQIPLAFDGLSFGALAVDGDAAVTAPEPGKSKAKGSPVLLLRGGGERKLTAEFTAPITSETGRSRMHLQLPAASANSFTLTLPPNTRVESSQPAQIAKTAQATTATLALPASACGVDLNWRAAGEAVAGATVLSETANILYTIDAEKLHAEFQLTLTAALGDLPDRFEIAVHPEAQVLQVEGDEVARWSADDGKVTVELPPRERTKIALRLVLELPSLAGESSATLALPVAEVAGVRRITGAFSVAGRPGVMIKEIAADALTRQIDGATERAPELVGTYTFAGRLPDASVFVERMQPRFRADLDTLVELKSEAVFIERTLTLHEEKGELFTALLTIPAGEEVLAVRRADDSEPDWRMEAGQLRLRWSDRVAQPRVFKVRTRSEPPAWTQLGAEPLTVAVADAKIEGAEKVTGYIAVGSEETFRIEAEPSETLERRDGRTTPVRGDYAWFRRDEFALNLKVAKRPAEVLAALTGYALPLEGVLDLHATIDFTFLHSGARSVRIRVPEALAQNFHFDGPQIAERNLAGDTWTILFQKELTGGYPLSVAAQIPIARNAEDASRFAVALPMITPLGVQRLSGVWAVEANTDTEVTFETKGLNELDTLHAPALPGYAPRHRVIGVFGFIGESYSLGLAGVRHPPAAVLNTVVEGMEIDTVVSTSGNERSEAKLLVLTAGAQFLDVTLPHGSRLWSLVVNDEAVKPVGDQPEHVRVRLPAQKDTRAVITASLLYETPKRALNRSGRYESVAPRLAPQIPILRSRWRVFVPDGFSYTGLESNLRVPWIPGEPLLVTAPYRRWQDLGAQAVLASSGISDPRALHMHVGDEAAYELERGSREASVAALLAEAEGFMSTGRYDLAFKRYEQVLDIDRYNIAARKGQEKINLQRDNYALSAYNETRSRATWKVDQAWANPVRRSRVEDESTRTIEEKLNQIIIPKLEFREATLQEAVNFLTRKAIEHSPEADPAHRGVSIMLNAGEAGPIETKITVSLTNIPLLAALTYVAQLAGLEARVEPSRVVIAPPLPPGTLVSRTFKLPLDDYRRLAGDKGGSPQELLEREGVSFPSGTSATYSTTTGELIVTNTTGNLAMVEAVLESKVAGASPETSLSDSSGTFRISNKLNRIIIPQLELREATIREAIEFLHKKAQELDLQEPDPAQRGLSFVLKLESSGEAAPTPPNVDVPSIPGLTPLPDAVPQPDPLSAHPGDARITVSLTNIPLAAALTYVTQLAGLKYKVEPYAVSIVPQGTPTEVLVTSEYRVPPSFFKRSAAGNAVISAAPTAGRLDAKEYLVSQGVPFPQGASATYLPRMGRLVVRNTQENLDLVDTLIPSGSGPDAFAQTRVAGLLPLKLELPRVGQQLVFEGFYGAEKVGFSYEDWWARARRLWFWLIGGGVAFLVLAWRRPWWRSAWAVLVLTFFPLCVSEGMTAVCNALLLGWLIALVLHRIAARFVFVPSREEVLAR